MAGMLFISGSLLFYTAMVVPVQIFMWDYSDPCTMFPTLYFDVLVDTFFMVSIDPRLSASKMFQLDGGSFSHLYLLDCDKDRHA
jgi:hypothetical protein